MESPTPILVKPFEPREREEDNIGFRVSSPTRAWQSGVSQRTNETVVQGDSRQSTVTDGRGYDCQVTSNDDLDGVVPVTQRRRAAVKADISMSARRRLLGEFSYSKYLQAYCSMIVQDRTFVVSTGVLTVYALVGDDIRQYGTERPADVFFDIITFLSIAVFAIEIVLSCIGISDYLFGFFFYLDLVSTATLVLDLSAVANAMSNGDTLDKMRSGRTARVGAKAGRVVRLIRLVRILKLYKAVQITKKNSERRSSRRMIEEDDWDFDEEEQRETAVDMVNVQESRVGKKLSEMTTRRVIILVLTMLISMPYLTVQSNVETAASPFYGADEVLTAYMEMLEEPSLAERVLRYQKSVLKMLYYHNWFTGNQVYGSCKAEGSVVVCPDAYYLHLFWFGIEGYSRSAVEMHAANAALTESAVLEAQRKHKTSTAMYDTGTYPDEVLPLIYSPWTVDCPDELNEGHHRVGVSLLSESIDGVVGHTVKCPDDLRPVERNAFYALEQSFEEHSNWHFVFYFDARPLLRQEAFLGILTTFFICFVLCVGSLYFSNDANKLVLGPLEAMIDRLEMIRKNPLVAMKMADEEFKEEEKLRAKKRQEVQLGGYKQYVNALFRSCWSSQGVREPMETVVLEKTIIKLGSLLALGFGAAGANVIANNMASADSAGVNVMIPGVLVDCIIGNARICNFAVATEVLQAKVLTFVNQIAEIVHGVVEEFHGSPNKNNGDTFQVIWRTSGLEELDVRKMADMSVCAMAKILGSIQKSSTLAAYRQHPQLQQRFSAHYHVCLKFGLHAGWAIEGTVGSEYKIDASYLSPHVNIAATMEKATSVYHVPVLVSEAVRGLMTLGMASELRLIDRVSIRASKEPLCIYSLDLHTDTLHVEGPKYLGNWNSRQRFKARQFLESEKQTKMSRHTSIDEHFYGNDDIEEMRRHYSVEFKQIFSMGFTNYSEGEWQVARRLLSRAKQLSVNAEDGPCIALLDFMEQYQFKAPDDWAGVRQLVEGDTDTV
eukprot:TRINITY_DN111088_c0_g1_i1.p1 TRINITY_DN111088_c0_g1~~TRINITY_DN111088_c0_g1_i1.p1  ORF type:complete len:1002 (+),score=175.31 TRINITY_DN111088_c0_g1_i1:91-3096(+)